MNEFEKVYSESTLYVVAVIGQVGSTKGMVILKDTFENLADAERLAANYRKDGIKILTNFEEIENQERKNNESF